MKNLQKTATFSVMAIAALFLLSSFTIQTQKANASFWRD
jgi:hypothetical protein